MTALRAERAIALVASAIVAAHAWFLLGAAAPSTHVLSPLAPQVKGPTFDEYYYISAGVSYVKTGDFSENREHPPLAKLMTGAAVAAAPDLDFPETWRDLLHFPVQFFYHHNGADQARNLFLARLPVVALALVLDVAVFLCIRRAFGPWCGLTALALFAFDPSCVAAAATANLDFPSAAFSFFALAAFRAALGKPSAWRTLGAGIALGLALLTKFTALLLFPALVAMTAASVFERRSARPMATLALVVLASLTAFAAGYGFEMRSLASVKTHPKYVRASGQVLERSYLREPVEFLFGRERGIPLLTALKGLDHTLSETGQIGHRGYLLGESTPMVPRVDPETGRTLQVYRGWKSFYAAVLVQKLPPLTLVFVCAGCLLVFFLPLTWVDRAFLLVFPLTVLVQFSLGNAQLGVKYVLPALVPLFAAGALVASHPRAAPFVSGAAIAAGLLTLAAIHPDEPLYASPLAGGPETGARVACVGDEWGQDAPGLALFARDLDHLGADLESRGAGREVALDEFLRAHGSKFRVEGEVERRVAVKELARTIRRSGVAYRYYGQGKPAAYGFEFEPLGPGPCQGIVAVHATNLYRENEDFAWLERFDPAAAEGEPMPGIFGLAVPGRWIVGHRPIVKIGYGIYVYMISGR